MPPASSGGTALIQMLNVLEGFDLAANGGGRRGNTHLRSRPCAAPSPIARAISAIPDFEPGLPVATLMSKVYAAGLRTSPPAGPRVGLVTDLVHVAGGVRPDDARFGGRRRRNAVAMTFTLEDGYGLEIVVPGAGFLLNNEMGDFNAAPGLTDATGLIGTGAEPGGAREAHAVEHDADDCREERGAADGHRRRRRPHDHLRLCFIRS